MLALFLNVSVSSKQNIFRAVNFSEFCFSGELGTIDEDEVKSISVGESKGFSDACSTEGVCRQIFLVLTEPALYLGQL